MLNDMNWIKKHLQIQTHGFRNGETGVQLLSIAKAIEIKATIKEWVHWGSQNTDYIRASRQSSY